MEFFAPLNQEIINQMWDIDFAEQVASDSLSFS
jgi:hypothetical protein